MQGSVKCEYSLNIIIRDASGEKLTEIVAFKMQKQNGKLIQLLHWGAQTMSITGILNGTGNVWFDEVNDRD